MLRRLDVRLLFFLALSASAANTLAQEYPTKAIRILVPLAPGSGADSAARIIAQRMGEHWKQPVTVENRPGTGGQAGTAAVVNAEGDGHTLLVQSSSHLANAAISQQLPYDPQKDLAEVAMLGKTPYLMVTAANGPYKSLKALIEAARAQPGTIPFASAGIGSSTHLAAEYLVALAGIKMVHLPFRGSPDAMQDVLGGRSAFSMVPINAGAGLVKDGKLRALGVSTKTRAEALPDVPSVAEQGLYDYDTTLWFGLWAPSATPVPVVQKLNAAVNAIVLEPQVKAQFARLGIQPSPMKAEDFAKFVRSEMEVYKKVVEYANIPRQ